MSIFSKIGKGLKKVVKFALPIVGGVVAQQALGGIVGGVKSIIGGISPPKTTMGPNDGPQLPTSYQTSGGITNQVPNVNVESSGGTGISSAMQAGLVGAMNMEGVRETNAANAQMAQRQMDFQAAQARQQMDFQREQTSTSYQRGVKDLRAAGLNPMLAYTQGGASSGSGASGSGASAVMQNELGAGANSAMSALQTLTELERIRSTTDNIDASTANVAADTANKLMRKPLIGKQTEEKELDIKRGMTEWRIRREAADNIISEIASGARLREYQSQAEKYGLAEKKAWSGFYDSSIGSKYPYASKATEQANSAANVFRKFVPFTSN